jgi:hypothetical protein
MIPSELAPVAAKADANDQGKVEAERRRFVRYRISLPVAFGMATGPILPGGGFTRDVSAGGAFVLTAYEIQLPEAGTPMWMRITIPAGNLGSDRPAMLQLNARSERGEQQGFAVSFDTSKAN